jgi:DNA-binding NarL/FixJ family response regulator
LRKPTVIIADDHDAVREIVTRLLEGEFEVIDAVADGLALLEAVPRSKPDAAVVDISMPRMGGIEAVRLLRKTETTAVVFLTTLCDPAVAAYALTVGGLGYVLKASADRDLVLAIRAALKGHYFVSPSV